MPGCSASFGRVTWCTCTTSRIFSLCAAVLARLAAVP